MITFYDRWIGVIVGLALFAGVVVYTVVVLHNREVDCRRHGQVYLLHEGTCAPRKAPPP